MNGLKQRSAELEVLIAKAKSALDDLGEYPSIELRIIVDWMSRRVTAILEAALQEDRATSDATTYACIDVNQRASATILAKQDCVLAGLGCIARVLDVYASSTAR